jgi:hypothetical protein
MQALANPTVIKAAAFIIGSAFCAASLVPNLAPFAGALGSFGGALIGWSGFRRPGDSAPKEKP